MESTLPKLSGRSDLAAAMRYALARRGNLLRYLDDGCLAIDNNPAERALRGIALGRKNYLFAGSDAGGERRSEEHTSELQSLMRLSYAVFCLTKKKDINE